MSRRPQLPIVDLATHTRAYVTLEQIADYLGVDRRTVKAQWLDTGELPAGKVGQQWRIETQVFRDFLKGKNLRAAS